ncbi:MAG: hypothetical protein ABIL62_04095 [Planctomycetota bacterium]
MAKKEETPEPAEKPEGETPAEQDVSAEQPETTEQLEIPKEPGPPILKPGKVTAIGGMRIGSGVCNILAGLFFCWLIVPIIMIPLGIVEIVSGSNLLKAKPGRLSSLLAIPILEIIAILTLAGWVRSVGIISLVFLSDQGVKSYLDQL